MAREPRPGTQPFRRFGGHPARAPFAAGAGSTSPPDAAAGACAATRLPGTTVPAARAARGSARTARIQAVRRVTGHGTPGVGIEP
ncbi:hypothetical protein ABTY53_37410 [Streptomyces noursei]|uniref:hypothetical protein n=1 Tax=Streptomyces noursei TaxID=1971 RepID=UPI0033180B48